VSYKAIDSLYRTDRVSNCIHAIDATIEGPRARLLSPGWAVLSLIVLLSFNTTCYIFNSRIFGSHRVRTAGDSGRRSAS